MAMTRVKRPTLNDLELSNGKRTRLHRLLYKYGPANGTLLLLPIDQGLEHGPRDFFVNPPAKDPEFQLRLAKEGGFSGIVFQVGIAEKYMQRYAGEVPLVLKLNGKTEIPSDKAPLSPCLASVEDAVRLGADAVGYTLYVGSARQDEDFMQFRKVREDADRYGMPIIVWSYPRGEFIDAKGGRDSLYAVDECAQDQPGERPGRPQALQYPAPNPRRGNQYGGRVWRAGAGHLQRRRDGRRRRFDRQGEADNGFRRDGADFWAQYVAAPV